MKGGRKLSAWNLFVKKVYKEGKSQNKNYSFKQALADASSRKSEMSKGITNVETSNIPKQNKNNKTKKGISSKKGGKSRRRKTRSRFA
jgi:hypothetical protein